MARKPTKLDHSPPEFHLETLERRILFSADAALTALDVLPELDTELVMLQQSQEDEARAEDSIHPSDVRTKELVIVDSALPDLQKLLHDISRSALEGTQVVVLDAQTEVLTAISDILAEQRDLTAVHVLSHGSHGVLEFGEQRIETMDLLARASDLVQWRSALALDADILLHGYESDIVGIGQPFEDTLARLTGTEVSTSTTLTGFADQQADDGQLEDPLSAEQNEIILSTEQQPGEQEALANNTVSPVSLGGFSSPRHALAPLGSSDNRSIESIDNQPTDIFFVQADLPDKDTLVADLLQGALNSGRSPLIVMLDTSEDGIDQISTALSDLSNLDAIHLVTHGAHGLIQLGDSLVSASNVNQHIGEIQRWGTALNETGDILIYGCDVAFTAEGQWLVQQLGEITGADVAASDDTTGHADLDSDWVLEYRYGELNTDIPLNDEAQTAWIGTLDIASNLLLRNTFDTDATDSSGNGYNGTLTNGAVIDTTSGTNQIGGGKASFDGIDDYVDLSAHVVNFDNLAQGTIAVWMYADSVTGASAIFQASHSADVNSRVAVIQDNDEIRFFVQEGNTILIDALTFSANLTAGTWNHVVVTVDGSGNDLYVNGVEQGVSYSSGGAITSGFFDDVNDLDFMAWGVDKFGGSAFGGFFNGFLDDGRIYDRALSASDVTELYNFAGTPNPQTYTVTNTLDDSSVGSLRWAITQANANLGADTIDFNIAGSGTQVINLGASLPSITEEVTIDGTTQTGWVEGSFYPIVLDGNDGAFDGLTLTATADNSTLRGLVIRDFGEDGIQIDAGSTGNTIAGNFIGQFDSDGTVLATSEIMGGSGIEVLGANNTIGGITTADRNVFDLDQNYEGSIRLEETSATGNVIAGNYVGTTVDGNSTIDGSGGYGVLIIDGASSNNVGGASSAHRNVFGAFFQGVGLDTYSTGIPDANTIQSNYFGLGTDGTTVLPLTGEAAVTVYAGSNTIIGGVGAGNTIVTSNSSNGFWGLRLFGDSTIVQGNYIGTDSTRTIAGGFAESGIFVQGGGDNTQIGGIGDGEGNVIANNLGDGVHIDNSLVGVSIRGNSISNNDGIGIDLGIDGVTPNDAGDVDTGANSLQNWAVLTSSAIADDGTFSYQLDTTTLASGSYTIDFYASTDRDGGQVEGERYLGTITGVAHGNSALIGTLPGITLATGEFVTLITTDGSGNSSEFSTYAMAMDGDSDGVSPEDIKTTATTDGGLGINADGGNDIYLIADKSLFSGQTETTIEVQFSADAPATGKTTLFSYTDPVTQDELFFGIEPDGELIFRTSGGTGTGGNSITNASNLFDGNQHSVAVTWTNTGGILMFYVDGEQLGLGRNSYQTSTTIDAGGTVVIGQHQTSPESGFDANDTFAGTIHNVRVFDDVRTEAEIAASYHSELPFDEAGLMAQWTFDVLSVDGIITDTVGGNNLTVKHTDEVGFTASKASLTFGVDENALDGTIVGSVFGIDAEREARIASTLAADPDLRYSAETGKFYKAFSTSANQATALSNATSETLEGVAGQLMTIRDATEQQLAEELASMAGGDIWLGATDATVEGEWRWLTGGSEEDQFWQGQDDGYSPVGAYSNWFGGRPDSGSGNEDVVKLRISDGLWDDYPSSTVARYAVEWDADSVLDVNQDLTYAITAQSVGGTFDIDIDTGEIRVLDGTLLDADTLATHTLTVEVTDVDLNTYSEDFTVSLNDLIEDNSAPTDLSSGIELNTDGGNDAYLATTSGQAILGGLTEFTFESKVAFSDTGGHQLIVYSTTSYNDAINIQVTESSLRLSIHDNLIDLNAFDFSTIKDGKIHDITLTWDNSHGEVFLYIDGDLVDSTIGFAIGLVIDSDVSNSITIGMDTDVPSGSFQSFQTFRGTHYDVRIWDEVRSASEIVLNHQHKFDSGNLPYGLVANWQMDGFNGSNEVVDVVSANNLSIGHATGSGFTISTPVEDLHISENASNGTSVGFVVPSDPDVGNDIVSDGLFLEAGIGGTTSFTEGQTFGAWTVTSGSVQHTDAFGDGPQGGNEVALQGTTSAIGQSLATVAGRQYQVIFDFTGDWTGAENVVDGRVSAAGQSLDFSKAQPSGWSVGNNPGWEPRAFVFTANAASTDLAFAKLDTVDKSIVLGGVRVIEIPAAITTILNNDPTLEYDAATGKFYRNVSTTSLPLDAITEATSAEINGVSGQLATVRSAYENEVIRHFAIVNGNDILLGGRDATSEGDWYFLDGTTESDQFSTGSTAESGYYVNWASPEPNGNTSENHLAMSTSGGWFDVPDNQARGYVIEWDASEVLSNFTFSLNDNAGGRFSIDGNTGEIIVADSSLIDYESATSHDVNIQVTDAAGNSYAETMSIAVDNGMEANQTVPVAQSVDEDAVLTFSTGNGNAVSVSDSLAGTDSLMRVTLSVNDGVLLLSGFTGITFVEGASGSGALVIDGTESDINAALEGMTFAPDADFNGSVTLNMTTTLAVDLDAHYTFGAGDASDDSAGTTYNGTFRGDATTVIDPDRGEVLILDGDKDYVEIAGMFGNPADVTLAAWVNVESSPGDNEVLSLGDNFLVRIRASGELIAYHRESGASRITTSGAFVGSGWNHVAVAFDDTNDQIRLYLNGAEVASRTETDSIVYERGTNTFIGTHGFNNTSFDLEGMIDDARIYSRALSADEIAALATDQTEASDSVAITIDPINDAPTFGIGDGIVTTGVGAGDDTGRGVAVQADGKLLVAGYSHNGIDFDFALTRYNADGSLDVSFGGGDGIVTTDVGAGTDYGTSVSVQADGKILVAGISHNGSNEDFALTRYNADGSLDVSFGGGDGIVTTDVGAGSDQGTSVSVQADGKILVAGYSLNGTDFDFALTRYNADGSLDFSFGGGDGIVTTDVGAGNDFGRSVSVQADGKILVAGLSHNGTDNDFALTRYNTDGSLDVSFGGGDGIVTTDVGVGTDHGSSVSVQADGKILVAGQSHNGSNDDFALTRYNADGSLDVSFGGGDGIVTTDVGAGSDYGYSVSVQADGKILVAGLSHNGSNDDFALTRYNADGSLDVSFGGGDGIVTADVGAGNDVGWSVSVQADGKILVAGYSHNGTNDDFALVRYNTDGTLDATFDMAGTLDGTSTFIEGGSAVVLDPDVIVFDAELSALDNFNGATLTLARNGGADADDVFSESGLLGVMTQAGSLVYDGVTIGTVTTNSGGALVLTFNSNATQERVDGAMQAIAYSNSSHIPPTSVQLDWTFNDGNLTAQGSGGAQQAVGNTTVDITPVEGSISVTVNDPGAFGLQAQASQSATSGDATFLSQAVALNNDGSYVVVWTSDTDGDGQGVYFQRYDALGTTLGTETRVNTTVIGHQNYASVAMDHAGNYVVVWDGEGSGDTAGVFGQRFDASGVAQGGEFQVNTTTAGSQSRSSVAMDTAGNFVVVWDGEGAGDAFGVFAQRYDGSGAALGSEFLINSTTAGVQLFGEVSMDSDGNFSVTWSSNGQDGSGYGVYVRRFDADGTPINAEIQVDADTAGSQILSQLDVNDAGDFVIVWHDDGATDKMQAQLFNADGSKNGSEIIVSDLPGSADNYPAVALSNDGSFVVVWQGFHDGNDYGIVARPFDASGTATSGSFVVNSRTEGGQEYPAISMNDSGQFVIAFEDWTTSTVESRVYGLTTTEEGGTASVDVVLDVAPSADVTIALSMPDATEGSLSTNLLTFTDLNWNTAQTVTLTGLGDALNDGDIRHLLVFDPASSTDLNFDGLDTADLVVSNLDSNPLVDLDEDDSVTTGVDFSVTYVENTVPVVIVDTDAVISDPDSSNLDSLVVTITNLLDGANEVLAADTSGTGITTGYTAGVLTLSGTDTVENYQQVLRTVAYENTSTEPDKTNRNITFVVSDGTNVSGVATATLSIANAADLSITAPSTATTIENTQFVYSGANVISVDDGIVADTPIQVTLSVANGVLTLADQTGVSFVEGADGSASMVIEGLESAINTALNGLVFTPEVNYNGSDTLAISVAIAAELQGYYTFENNLIDQSAGSENNGSLNGDASFVLDPERGNVLNLDGTDDSVTITGMYGNPANVTLAGWINLNSADINGADFISLGANIELRADNPIDGVAVVFYNGTTWTPIASNIDIAGAGWTHVAGTFDDANDQVTLYINGVIVGSLATSGSIAYTDGTDTVIGGHGAGDTDFDFNGLIDDARIYSRALTADEVAALATDQSVAIDSVTITIDAVNNAPAFNAAGEPSTLDATPTFTEGGPAVVLDVDVSVSDAELDTLNGGDGNYAGAELSLMRTGTSNSEDVFSFADGNGLTLVAGELIKSGQSVAVFDTSTTAGELVVTFTDANGQIPTTADVEFVAEQINYANTSHIPPANVQIDWQLNDGNTATAQGLGGARQVFGSTIVDITPVEGGISVSVSAPGAFGLQTQASQSASSGDATYLSQAVALNNDGSYVVVWTSDTDSDGQGVYSQRYDALGTPLGTETRVNTTVTGNQNYASVAMDTAGNYVVIWHGEGTGDTTGVFGQRFNANGVAQGSEFLINTTTTGDQDYSSVAMDSVGNFVVVWEGEGTGDTSGVFAQRYDASGSALGSEFLINSTTTDLQQFGEVSMDSEGNFTVTWTSRNQDGSDRGVYVRRFDADGTAITGEIQVDVDTAGSQWISQVDVNDAGNFVVVWRDDGATDSIQAQLFNADGSKNGSEIVVSDLTDVGDNYPTVKMGNDGSFVAVWQSINDGGSYGIYARVFDASGMALSGSSLVNSRSNDGPEYPAVSMNDSGQFVVAFEDWSNGTVESRVYGLATTEAGGTASVDVVLDVAPAADVTIALSMPDTTEGSLSTNLLTFTSANWNTPQTVTITGVDDSLNDGDIRHLLVFDPASSTDLNFDGLDVSDLIVSNLDNNPLVDLDDNNSAATGIDYVASWTENGGPVAVADADAILTDPDSATLASVTVTISNLLDGTDEVLAADTTGTSIVATYTSGTGVLLLSGSHSVEDYEQVLRTVTYNNASENPVATARIITFVASDGINVSPMASTSMTISTLNDAPVLDNIGTMTFTAITEDDINNAGQTVASIIASAGGDRITDAEGDPEGIAITRVNWGTDNSYFEYSIDAGVSWTLIDNQASDNALLLRATDMVRFQPRGYGVETASIDFRAWDQTNGSAEVEVDTTINGGSTAFSSSIERATITTTAVNDAPVFGVQPGASVEDFSDSRGIDYANDVVVLADGSSITAGVGRYNGSNAWVIAKFQANGGLDTGFGTGGNVINEFGSSSDEAYSILEQPDGKIVVGGYAYNGSNGDFALLRLNSDGSVDSGFGTAGRVYVDLGGSETGYEIVIQSDGKLLVTGSTSTNNLVVARLNGTDSSLDAGFGTGGIANIDLGASEDAYSIAVDSSDRIVVTGIQGSDAFVARLTTTGVLDTSFDTDGVNITNFDGTFSYGTSIIVQSDGSIVIVGFSDDSALPRGERSAFGVARFTSSGALDTTFAGDGALRTFVPDGANWYNGAQDIVQQADGKLLVAGFVDLGAGQTDWGIIRYNTDGSLDTSFNNAGILIPQTGRYWNSAQGIDVASDGTIVVAGHASYTGNYDTLVMRFNADGTVATVVQSGLVDASPTYTEGGAAVVLDGDVNVFDRELTDADNFDGSSLTLMRNGGADNDDVFSPTGLLGALTESGNLIYDGVTIGTVTTNSGGSLVLSFNASATNQFVNHTLRSIAYSNSSDAPPTSVQIDWTFDDGNTGSQGSGGNGQALGSTTVTITAVNDAPVITSDGGAATAAVSVDENQTAVTTVTATDVDDSDTQAYSITGGTDSTLFSINSTSGALTFNTAPDFETSSDAATNNVYDVTVQVDDGNGGTDTQAIAVTVNNVNEAPVISSDGGGATAAISAAENQTAVTTVTSTDVDGGTAAYSITGGADAALFSIDGSSGALTFNTAPDFETPADVGANNVYDVTVQVADGSGGTDTQAIAVTMTNINEDPVINSDGGGATAAISAAENQTVVTTVTSTDVDGGTAVYSITGDADAVLFSINSSSGVLTFNTAPDFETPSDGGADNVYNVMVQVADDNGGTDSQAIAVTVTNVNEAPVIDSGDVDGGVVDLGNGDTALTISVNENQLWVVKVPATDADAQETRTYSLTGGTDQSAFTIDSGTGDLSFVSPPDHEVKERYQVEVTVTDNGGLTAVQTLVINVQDLNESPTAQTDVMEANENQRLVIDPVSSLLSNDFDPEQDALRLVSFTQPQNGTLTLNTQGMLVYEPDDFFVGLDQFDYVVEDAGGNQVSARVWLDVRAFSDPILAAAQPVDNGLDESPILNPETAQTNQPGMSTELASAYPQEATSNAATGSSEPVATSEETPASTVATEDLFAASASVAISGQTSGSVHLPPPTRINGPIISSLLQQLLDHEITDLNASFDLQVFEQSASIELRDAIRALRGQIDQMFDQPSESSPLITFAPSVVGASLTAGIVTWVLRSGLLLSATITATPLWRPLDPVPILAQSDEDEPWYEKDTPDELKHGTTAANDPDKNAPDSQDVNHG